MKAPCRPPTDPPPAQGWRLWCRQGSLLQREPTPHREVPVTASDAIALPAPLAGDRPPGARRLAPCSAGPMPATIAAATGLWRGHLSCVAISAAAPALTARLLGRSLTISGRSGRPPTRRHGQDQRLPDVGGRARRSPTSTASHSWPALPRPCRSAGGSLLRHHAFGDLLALRPRRSSTGAAPASPAVSGAATSSPSAGTQYRLFGGGLRREPPRHRGRRPGAAADQRTGAARQRAGLAGHGHRLRRLRLRLRAPGPVAALRQGRTGGDDNNSAAGADGFRRPVSSAPQPSAARVAGSSARRYVADGRRLIPGGFSETLCTFSG